MIFGKEACTIWLTGLSGSGKSTIAHHLKAQLFERYGVEAIIIDGDVMRKGLNRDLGFNPADRTENIRRFGEVAKFLTDNRIINIVAAISPYARDRETVRAMQPDTFVEVFVDVPLETAELRDPKGLYKKARAGQIKDFTGIDAPYERPIKSEIRLETDIYTAAQCAENIIEYLRLKER